MPAMTAPAKAPRQTPPARFAASGFFAFRTPLLPVEELLALGTGLAAPALSPDAGDAALEAALAADRETVRARLRELATRPEVREAIFVASPSLDESVPAWLEAPDGERGAKVERTLVRYVYRMAGRPTPFGLFAGCSVGDLGTAPTRIDVGPRAGYERHTRLDMDYVCALVERLARDPELRPLLTFRPNSSLYPTAGKLRYAEARLETAGGGRNRSYHLVAVDHTEYLAAALERARDGARPGDIAEVLLTDPEITAEDAGAFVNELIDNQVLVPDLEPAVTGPEPIHALVSTLSAQAAAGERVAEAAALLAETRDAIDAIDRRGVGGNGAARYREIASRLERLGPVELPRLFQVDMVKPAPAATLSEDVVKEVLAAVDLLHRMSGGGDGEALRAFRQKFAERYETREVPLVEALDEESGIGFDRSEAPGAEASPLLEGIVFGAAPREGSPTVPWGAREQLLLEKLTAAARRGARAVELEPADVARLERPAEARAPLPDAFSFMGCLLARSAEAAAAGEYQLFFQGVSGPSGANLLGRFCHGDPRLEARVREHLAAEEANRPGAIFAEIVHLPEGRIGNVIARPLLRGHEIVYLGRSGAPPEAQIPINDLLVRVAGGRVVLRSARLGREVIPRLTNAHNYSHARNLSVYRFLCAVMRQGIVGGVGWSWGALDGAPHLPRLTAGRVVLSLERWRVPKAKLETLGAATAAGRWRAAQALRRELGLPRWVAVADGDNELPIDLDNLLSVETFVQLVKDRGEARLDEIPSFEETLPTTGPEGRFVHELVIPFARVPQAAAAAVEGRAAPRVPRSFAPGSEWLYAKLYTGHATADQVLREVVAPVVAEATASGAARRWFFIRYGDPEWHVRLRLQGEPGALAGVLPLLHRAAAPLLDDGRMWRMQLDTYEREVERYGGPRGVELSEELFCADSEAVLAIVETLSGDEGADARWRLALRGIDRLFDDLGLDLAGRRRVIETARPSFAREFGGGVALDKQLGDKYRRLRNELEALLAAGADDDWLGPGLAAFDRRSQRAAAAAAALRAAEAEGALTTPLLDLAGSYMHMHVNRLARSAARAQELVLYDFLKRLYESRAARAKKGT
jgi:thiopeptide-type bacteriocin biosynthesis protein